MRLSVSVMLVTNLRYSSAFTNQRMYNERGLLYQTLGRESFQCAVRDEVTPVSNQTTIDSDNIYEEEIGQANLAIDGSDTFFQNSPKFSKAKWKKKRFLMIRDIKKLVEESNPNASKKAEEMVRRMRTLYEKSGDVDIRPPLQAYNLWINALAKSKQPEAGRMAENVLRQMKEHNVEPNIVTYTSIIDAHARSQNPGGAEGVLLRLLDETRGSNSLGFSSITCDTILNAWAQQGTRESAERAQLILFRLEEWQRDNIRPTKISYATVMNAWARVGSTEAAERAEALLHRMLEMKQVQPDTIVFNAAINVWATSKDAQAGKRALAILRKMRALPKDGVDTAPDIVTYNTVLSAWAHSGDVNAAPYTEKIVQEMQTAAAQSNKAPAPNTVTYNTILNAWAKSKLPGAAPRAQKVLDYMIQSGKDAIVPDVISFASVLDAWAKSKEPHKGAKSQDLLNRLIAMFNATKNDTLRPTAYTYNAVLNACAFSAMGTTMDEKREALQIAVQTFSSMRNSETPLDTVTYGNMLKCLANLMPEGDIRSNMALQVFDKCINDGLVGTLVWNEIRRAVPAKQLAKTYKLNGPIGIIQVRDLPRQWKKSNRDDKKAPQTKRIETESDDLNRPRPTWTIVETSACSGKDL